MWTDDLAATPPGSDVELTPPSPSFFPTVSGADALGPETASASSAPPAGGDAQAVGGSLDAPACSDTVGQLFARLDAEKDRAAGPRRRGRPARVHAILDRMARDAVASPVVGSQAPPDAALAVRAEVGVESSVLARPMDVCADDLGSTELVLGVNPMSTMHLAVRDGYAVASPLSTHVAELARVLRDQPRPVSSDIKELCVDKVASGCQIGLKADADRRGIDWRTLRISLHRWSCIFLALMYRWRECFETRLVDRHRDRAVHDLEWQRHDETPLPLRVVEAFMKVLLAPVDDDAQALRILPYRR